mmetsp:Transcript_22112/g.78776  ORF Transcript_22112/g.78776 Transcript_22112/m.78776 type:complete len:200 (-) Transcript_22112:37-636(-)
MPVWSTDSHAGLAVVPRRRVLRGVFERHVVRVMLLMLLLLLLLLRRRHVVLLLVALGERLHRFVQRELEGRVLRLEPVDGRPRLDGQLRPQDLPQHLVLLVQLGVFAGEVHHGSLELVDANFLPSPRLLRRLAVQLEALPALHLVVLLAQSRRVQLLLEEAVGLRVGLRVRVLVALVIVGHPAPRDNFAAVKLRLSAVS